MSKFHIVLYLTLSGNLVGCETRDVVAVDGDSDEHSVLITDRQAESACLEPIQVLSSRLEASGLDRVDNQCWVCLRTYAGSRGLKLHLAKSSCGRGVEVLIELIERHSASVQSVRQSIVVPESGVLFYCLWCNPALNQYHTSTYDYILLKLKLLDCKGFRREYRSSGLL